MNHPKVIKINNPETRDLVADLAREDNDNMQIPTHAVIKGEEIVGGWNLCEVPIVLAWHHTKKVTARNSIMLTQIMESMVSQKGYNQHYIACNSHSPYYEHMGQLGFNPVWTTNIFHKNLPKI